VKQILEDETMMNRETQVLQEIKHDQGLSVINLRCHFYSAMQASVPGDVTAASS
jgi:hypothetical protein